MLVGRGGSNDHVTFKAIFLALPLRSLPQSSLPNAKVRSASGYLRMWFVRADSDLGRHTRKSLFVGETNQGFVWTWSASIHTF